MTTQLRNEELHFSVEGELIMNLAREAYWFEDRQEWALDLLSTLQGMTIEQSMNILRGEATLSGRDIIEYSQAPDQDFKNKLKAHLQFLAEKTLKEKEQLEAELDEQERSEERKQVARRAQDRLTELFTDQEHEPISDPISFGSFKVSKALLDQYLHTYVEHHFAPVSLLSLRVSSELMRLHRRLRNSVGLKGFWGRGEDNKPDDFDTTLQELCWKAIKKDKRELDRKRLQRYGVDSDSLRLTRDRTGD